MSNQYNYAGRSIIVDEVIEVRGTRQTSTFRQQLDAQLIKRDVQGALDTIDKIGSDNVVTSSEKIILEREWAQAQASHPILVAKVDELGVSDHPWYDIYLEAYHDASDYLEALLGEEGDSEIGSREELTEVFEELYSTQSALEELFFRITTGMITGLDNRMKFDVLPTASRITAPLDNTPFELSVILHQEGEDVTDEYPDADFVWKRVSEDREADKLWRGGSVAGKVIEVSLGDLVGGTTFGCRFTHYYSDTMFYSKSGFIAISPEIPGPPGEDAISIQLFSSNGNTFRSGQAYTTISATVWRGDKDITDELDAGKFNWERKSGDVVADESWNTSSKAVGRKSIELSPEDVFGRSVFACHVKIGD